MKLSQNIPLYFFYTMVQKGQKWPKTQINGGGGGPALTALISALTILKKVAMVNIFYQEKLSPVLVAAHWVELRPFLNVFSSGVDGMMRAYEQCIHRVTLWMPTNAAPIIMKVADMAQRVHDRFRSLVRNFKTFLIELCIDLFVSCEKFHRRAVFGRPFVKKFCLPLPFFF